MNTKQMQAALAKINPTKAVASNDSKREPMTERIAASLASALPIARKNVSVFTKAFSTSYQYHEAVRKGLI